MPTRTWVLGVERRVLCADRVVAVFRSADCPFRFRRDAGVVHGGSRAGRSHWLGGVPRECVYDNLRVGGCQARQSALASVGNQRFLHLRSHYAFHSTACTPSSPREKGSVEGAVWYLKTGFWPGRRWETLPELDQVYGDWRNQVAHRRRHATGERGLGEIFGDAMVAAALIHRLVHHPQWSR